MTSKESDKEFWSRVSELPYTDQDRAQLVRQIDELSAEVERLGLALEAIAEHESPEGHIAREALARTSV